MGKRENNKLLIRERLLDYSFNLFQKISSDSKNSSEEERKLFFNMINDVLGDLPEESINDFAQSEEFEIYKIIGERYG